MIVDVGFHLENRQNVEKVSSALQLILAGLMFMGLLTVKVLCLGRTSQDMLIKTGIATLVGFHGTFTGGYREPCLLPTTAP